MPKHPIKNNVNNNNLYNDSNSEYSAVKFPTNLQQNYRHFNIHSNNNTNNNVNYNNLTLNNAVFNANNNNDYGELILGNYQ